jgi:hypothetical protein
MKALLLRIVTSLAVLTLGVAAGELEWGTDLAKAQAKARLRTRRFSSTTGSDWCGFCIKLQKVFTTAGSGIREEEPRAGGG